MFLCSNSSTLGLWLSRLEGGEHNFHTLSSLYHSDKKVGQTSKNPLMAAGNVQWLFSALSMYNHKRECNHYHDQHMHVCRCLVSAVPICVRMASHCSLLCQVKTVCPGGWLSLELLSWINLSLSGAEGRQLSFKAKVSFLFTLLARAPEQEPSREICSGRYTNKNTFKSHVHYVYI